jgi:S-formylglutathione hydrolase FrmB
MAEGLTTLKQHRCFGGIQGVYRHESSATQCAMEFAVYQPPQAAHGPVPVLYWLSGLTCTWARRAAPRRRARPDHRRPGHEPAWDGLSRRA